MIYYFPFTFSPIHLAETASRAASKRAVGDNLTWLPSNRFILALLWQNLATDWRNRIPKSDFQ